MQNKALLTPEPLYARCKGPGALRIHTYHPCVWESGQNHRWNAMVVKRGLKSSPKDDAVISKISDRPSFCVPCWNRVFVLFVCFQVSAAIAFYTQSPYNLNVELFYQ